MSALAQELMHMSHEDSMAKVTSTLAREAIRLSDAEVGFCLTAMRHFFPTAPHAACELFARDVARIYVDNALNDYLKIELDVRVELAHRNHFVPAGPYDSPGRWAKGFVGACLIADDPYMGNLACLAVRQSQSWYDAALMELVDHMRYSQCMAAGWLARNWGVAP